MWLVTCLLEYAGYFDVAYVRYVKYAGVAEPPFTLKPMVKPKSLTIFWSSTLGAIAAYRRNPVTTWPESSYDLARIWLRITEVYNEVAYEWNNNQIQTQQILCSSLQLARQRMRELQQGFEKIYLNATLEIWS